MELHARLSYTKYSYENNSKTHHTDKKCERIITNIKCISLIRINVSKDLTAHNVANLKLIVQLKTNRLVIENQ